VYRVFNRSKQAVLADKLDLAETSWTRMKGLLCRKSSEFPPGRGLWIAPCQGVHTVGMSFPIDVAYLDSERRVIHVCHSLAPFRVARLKFRARSVIELPAGTLARTRTTVGDVLEISEVKAEGGGQCATIAQSSS